MAPPPPDRKLLFFSGSDKQEAQPTRGHMMLHGTQVIVVSVLDPSGLCGSGSGSGSGSGPLVQQQQGQSLEGGPLLVQVQLRLPQHVHQHRVAHLVQHHLLRQLGAQSAGVRGQGTGVRGQDTGSTSILPSSLAPTRLLASSRGLEGRNTSTELTATWGGRPAGTGALRLGAEPKETLLSMLSGMCFSPVPRETTMPSALTW
ncbi:hypothetical protein EYF80_061186 [Liparis tanakae]|uniref:Uncharacterized protein n=1 Tax=Liparis tanakae TaxID=230148 RepID=A0A4Z2EII3_9TELE|nr:hypothetical protein EYF80_061186 [Liparis tanakae]